MEDHTELQQVLGKVDGETTRHNREMAAARRQRSLEKRRSSRKARSSIVSAASDVDSDDEASYEDGNLGGNIALGQEENVPGNHAHELAQERNIERQDRRSICSDITSKPTVKAVEGSETARRPSIIQQAGKHWGKLKAAIKIRQAMKDVHYHSKNKIKEDRNAIHNDIVKYFKTRLQKGDRLLAKTESMGYDFGSLRSHVDFIYQPSGNLRFILDMIVFVTMIASFYTTVYLFAFVPEALSSFQWFILYVAEVTYVFDAVHRSVVLYGSQHQPATKYTADDLILLETMKRYIFFHVVAAIPLNIWLSSTGMCGASNRYICSVPQTLKAIFFIDNLYNCKEHFLKLDANGRYHILIQRVAKFFQVLLVAFYCIHFIVNAWFYLNTLEDDSQNWFMVQHATLPNHANLAYSQLSPGYLYAQSLYTTILMLIGDGIDPCTRLQYYFTSFIMLLGIVGMALVIGEISSNISKLNHAKTKYELKLEDVAECMTNLEMPDELKNRVLDYYRFMWRTHRTTDGEPIPFMKELSPSLSDEVDLFLKRSLITKSELFKDAPADYLRALVPRLNHMICLRGDYIAREGEFGDTMYFIASGTCMVSLRNKRVAVLNKGSNFGEIAMIDSKERTASVLALTNVTLYVLHRNDVTALEAYFPNVLQEKIAEYLTKHNLVFSRSPSTQNKDIVKNLVEENNAESSNKTEPSPASQSHILSPANSEAMYRGLSPDNSTRASQFLVGKPNMQFIKRVASKNMPGRNGTWDGKIENTYLSHSYRDISEAHVQLQHTHSNASAELKEVISNIVSTEIRHALGDWIAEHQQHPQSTGPSEKFLRMSHGLQQKEEEKWTEAPSGKSINVVKPNKQSSSFDADEWRRAKILAKRKQMNDNMLFTPSKDNTPALRTKAKSKYIATAAQNNVESREN